jgi:phosphatidate cytidylyltransferase
MKRLLTAAVGIPAVVLLTIYGPRWLFVLVASGLSALMIEEFLNLNAARGRARPGRWFPVLGALVTAAFAINFSMVCSVLALVTMVLASAGVFAHSIEKVLDSLTSGIAALVYCSILMGFVILLPSSALLTLLGIIWAGDSLAYYGGRAFGRHPLAPVVSPKKTVEGAVAGLVGSVLAAILIGIRLLGQSLLPMAVAGLLIGGVGQIGDLSESALKRSAGVKDSSSILPGHGGILDRLDSLLFAAPIFYWFLYR